MTDATGPSRDGTLTEEQTVLIDEVIDGPHTPAFNFDLVNDEKAGVYEAVVDGKAIGGLPYDVVPDGRLVLFATSVFPEFRRKGVATELIRRALDDVRAQGKTVTAMCPIVRTFIEHNPGYADVINAEHPGAAMGSRRQS
jgi:predicted GNAT family acetyltransferase